MLKTNGLSLPRELQSVAKGSSQSSSVQCVESETRLSIISSKTGNLRQVYSPKAVTPLPVLSNSRKATMKRESGAHSTDSNATNSWKEIKLEGRATERKRIGWIMSASCCHFSWFIAMALVLQASCKYFICYKCDHSISRVFPNKGSGPHYTNEIKISN